MNLSMDAVAISLAPHQVPYSHKFDGAPDLRTLFFDHPYRERYGKTHQFPEAISYINEL